MRRILLDVSAMQIYTLISKTDIANGNELPGAHLTITNTSNNSVVDDWTSTNKSHKVLLEDGNYKLCETTAPQGYARKTECINFEVTNSKVEKVTMENADGLFGVTMPEKGVSSIVSVKLSDAIDMEGVKN